MSKCNECNEPEKPCLEGDTSCSCPAKDMSTDCSVYTGPDLLNSGIETNTVLTSVIQKLETYIFNKFEEAIQYLSLINIGTGAKIFKGISGIGNKELRTIEAGSDIVVTEGTDTILISNPPSTEAQRGVAEIATQVEVDAGVDDTRIVTPAKLSTYVANPANLPDSTETVKGVIEIATQAEVTAGVDTERVVVPATLSTYVASEISNPANLPNATELQRGVAEIATQIEVDAGVDDEKIITPAKLSTYVSNPTNLPDSTETVKGVAEIATQVETDAGVDDTRIVTPAKLSTYVANPANLPDATESVKGIAEIATQTEVDTGVDDTRIVTPAKLSTYVAGIGSIIGSYAEVETSVWTSYQSIVFNHGLGVIPKIVKLSLKCNSAALGYLVGDEIEIEYTFQSRPDSPQAFGITLVKNSTQIIYKINHAFNLPTDPRITSGGVNRVTYIDSTEPGNFSIVVRVFA